MKKYEVSVSLGNQFYEIEAENEKEAQNIAFEKAEENITITCVEIKKELTSLKFGMDNGELCDDSHSIQYSKQLKGKFKERKDNHVKIYLKSLTPDMFRTIIEKKIRETKDKAINFNGGRFSTDIISTILDMLSGLNGNEILNIFAAKDQPLFVQIDDEWIIICPMEEYKPQAC